jgi:glycosyltransferase involved in cell wall biosynthesis
VSTLAERESGKSSASSLSYVLVTPARNEEEFIELTIRSVVGQNLRPVKWVIVSDGSTDRTDEIVRGYAARHDWIEWVRMPERNERHFAGKVGCIQTACEHLRGSDYDIIGSLDADLSFDEHYFSFLLGKFAADPELGIAGTPFSEQGKTYDYRFSSTEYVSGACQLFRRECFEEIGGYVPVKGGGIDVIAVMTARYNGWRTRTFTDQVLVHHRPMGSATYGGRLASSFRLGQRHYSLGWHPVWQVFRSVYQMKHKPYVLGGTTLLAGYLWGMVRRVERPVTPEIIAFQRQDQLRRLRAFLTGRSLRGQE